MSTRPAATLRLDADLQSSLQTIKDRDGIPIPEQIRRALHMWFETMGISAQRASSSPRLMSEERRAQMHAAYRTLLHELGEAEVSGATHRVQIPTIFRRLGGRPIGSLSDTEKNEFTVLIATSLRQPTEDFDRVYNAMRRRRNRARPQRAGDELEPEAAGEPGVDTSKR